MKNKALDNQKGIKTPTLMPQIPFSSYIVAQKKSGKTTLLLNMLMDKSVLKGKFNRIYWISPTAIFDDKVKSLESVKGLTARNTALENLMKKKDNEILDTPQKKKAESLIFEDELHLTYLLDMLEEQKSIISAFNKGVADDICLILDDCVEANILKDKKFRDFLFKSRHYKISIIFISQSYFSLSKPLRLNNSQLIIFDTGNMKELNEIYKENNNGISWADFKFIFQEITAEPYHFLNINYDNIKKYRIIDSLEDIVVLE
jgi:hypothetical protein